MLFNSFQFVFLFLPITLIGFYVLGKYNRRAAFYFLTAASLYFYASWLPIYLLVITPSILINYAIVFTLFRTNDTRPRLSSALFWAGIAFNLVFLGYFKYRGFLSQIADDAFGANFVIEKLVLPLGISFITFQKIALLVDVRAGRVKQVSFKDYMLFVLFFPQLIAGPIVHFRELMPQFEGLQVRLKSENFAVGLTLFFTGMFKKVMLADPLAQLVNPIWTSAAAGGHPALTQAWAAALGYMLQLYFDFSGYSDMAIGAARLFGITLPFNFDSPLKAINISDYWARWHVTLTRFLTAYIYSPLSLALTRYRLNRGLTAIAGRKTTWRAFLWIQILPTIVTFYLSGIWHGAGYQFIVFGLLHGAALSVFHAWRLRRPKFWPAPGAPGARWAVLVSWALTFVFVVSAEVFFRAPSVAVALNVLAGMGGAHGVALPLAELHRFGPILARLGAHVAPAFESGGAFAQVWLMIALGLAIALGLPNSYEMLAAHKPALGFKPRPQSNTRLLKRLTWRPTPAWAAWAGVLTALSILSLGQLSDFLYWHF